jgi:glycosyltransferase involved in cell wall biosynthesis
VVNQYPPIGYGPAMDKALTTASRDVVITLDCDDTYPVEDIGTLTSMMNEGWDLISASRLPKKPDAMPLSNYSANVVFARLALLICGINSTDMHTGMRAYRKKLIDDFPYQPKGPALPVIASRTSCGRISLHRNFHRLQTANRREQIEQDRKHHLDGEKTLALVLQQRKDDGRTLLA